MTAGAEMKEGRDSTTPSAWREEGAGKKERVTLP